MDSDRSNAKRGSILGMAVTGVRNLLAVRNSSRDIFSLIIEFSFKVDEMSRVKTMRASTSIDEVDTSSSCVTFPLHHRSFHIKNPLH